MNLTHQGALIATITGAVATTDAARVMRRLCKHWSHKFPVQVEETSGSIQLNDIRVAMYCEPDHMRVLLENPDGEVPLRLTGVVAEHLQRMAGPDQVFEVKWSLPADAKNPA